mgnify:CR=1 FL=1
MRYSSQVKPISYLKANAAEVLTHLAEQREPMVITQNGEAKVVIQDIKTYENMQNSINLLKLIVQSENDIENKNIVNQEEMFSNLEKKLFE